MHPLAVRQLMVKNVLVNSDTTGFNPALQDNHHRDSEPSICTILQPPCLNAEARVEMP